MPDNLLAQAHSGSRSQAPTGGKTYFVPIEQTRPSTHVFTDEVGIVRRQVRDLGQSAGELHRRVINDELLEKSSVLAKEAPLALLTRLYEMGFAWRDIGRMLDVSVPAIQKWRKGNKMTAENRLRVARVVALVELVQHELINDPASWFEMPLKEGVAVNSIDICAAGKPELVFEYASEHSDVETLLDAFDADWRQKYMDDSFETFVATDGVVSIRPKQHP